MASQRSIRCRIAIRRRARRWDGLRARVGQRDSFKGGNCSGCLARRLRAGQARDICDGEIFEAGKGGRIFIVGRGDAGCSSNGQE